MAGAQTVAPAATEPAADATEQPGTAGFSVGQRVYVTSTNGIKLRNDEGEIFITAEPNSFGTILAGPSLLIPGRTDWFWKVAWSFGRAGWAPDLWLSAEPILPDQPLPAEPIPPQPPNTGRVIHVRVKPHGTPRPVYQGPSRDSGYVKIDPSHDAWLVEVGNGFWRATEFRWAGGEWWFLIEGTPVGSPPQFTGAGWVQYDWGNNDGADRERLDFLEVAGQDGLPLPDFNRAPHSWPPETDLESPPASPPAATGSCEAGYNVCIPPYPPDLDCGQVSARSFAVLGSDPHGFDEDGDGVACE